MGAGSTRQLDQDGLLTISLPLLSISISMKVAMLETIYCATVLNSISSGLISCFKICSTFHVGMTALDTRMRVS